MISTWKTLDSLDQLDQIIKDSYKKPVVLFKHSVTCGISARAKYMLEEDWNISEDDFDFYYLDLLAFRNVSNEIASRFSVQHQSPQIIIIKAGKAIFDMSHHRISAKSLEEALTKNAV